MRIVLGPAGFVAGQDLLTAGPLDDASASAGPILPLALLRPGSLPEICAVLEICFRHGIPVVPQGGLTGLSGGASPCDGAVALSLARFSGIERIDPVQGTMTVRAGTVLQKAQEAAEEAGFLFPVDLGARGSCQIGGIVSTNAGGPGVIRYGMTRDNLLGLEVVLADGTVLSHLTQVAKDNTGYDLRHLFCGAEGTLGIVTRAVFRLAPPPPPVQTALCAVGSFAALPVLLQRARRDLILSAFEVMWHDHFLISGGRGFFAEAPDYALLIEVQGGDLEAWLEAGFTEGLITDALPAGSVAAAERFWSIRESRHPERSLKGLHNLDVSIPLAATEAFVSACRAGVLRLDPLAQSLFFGHLGDGNLHVIIDLPGLGPEGKTLLQDLVYPLVREAGGSISAEHGIGRLKRDWLDQTRSPGEIAAMRAIRSALDPRGLMNPGKLF
ncbi:FAD-binding oxidoreductase [Sinirhodobacter populi]|uniref:FAD-binding oxidoreductase n=2 Tax=Paenirhodobacter populi TaxID=2306993 RepID=A0A443IQT1_9RHOB|nr:FAD-binding oxidoreductase [Sinirhodobacter populi]